MKPIISISLEELIKDLVIDKNLPEDLINVSEHKKKYSDNNKANLILDSDEKLKLHVLLENLYMIQFISPDDRLCGIIDLLCECGITEDILASLTSIDKADILAFRNDPSELSYDKKYKLATNIIFIEVVLKEQLQKNI